MRRYPQLAPSSPRESGNKDCFSGSAGRVNVRLQLLSTAQKGALNMYCKQTHITRDFKLLWFVSH